MAGSLQQLWAGWRSDYVASAGEEARRGDDGACVFCAIAASGPPSAENGVVWRGPLSLAVLNLYPYASGHLLVMPVRHAAELEDLHAAESAELWTSTLAAMRALRAAYQPDALNMGANLGRAGGAGVPGHVHLHVLPRWVGDTNFMTTVASVRVIPEDLKVAWQKISAAWPAT
jgi:ATP adenylyltransferase